MLDVVFIPYPSVCRKYPVLRKIPVFLPILWVVRVFQAILFKQESVEKQLSDIRATTSDNINRYHDELKYVGLDYNFKE